MSSFLHALAFFVGAYYLPVYFQILGSSATGAGVRMLPYSLGSSLTSGIGGIIVSRTGQYRMIIWISWAVFCIGYGLMTMLDSHSPVWETVVFTLLASLGLGTLFQVRYNHIHQIRIMMLTPGIGTSYLSSGCYAFERHGYFNLHVRLHSYTRRHRWYLSGTGHFLERTSPNHISVIKK